MERCYDVKKNIDRVNFLREKSEYDFVDWFFDYRLFLINVLRKSGMFDEDVFYNVFFSIYSRIVLKDLVLSDFQSYFLKACKYNYLTFKRRSSRLVLVQNSNYFDHDGNEAGV